MRLKDLLARAQRCMTGYGRARDPYDVDAEPQVRVAFPNGKYREQAHPNAPLALVVDHRNIGELAARMKLMPLLSGRPCSRSRGIA